MIVQLHPLVQEIPKLLIRTRMILYCPAFCISCKHLLLLEVVLSYMHSWFNLLQPYLFLRLHEVHTHTLWGDEAGQHLQSFLAAVAANGARVTKEHQSQQPGCCTVRKAPPFLLAVAHTFQSLEEQNMFLQWWHIWIKFACPVINQRSDQMTSFSFFWRQTL